MKRKIVLVGNTRGETGASDDIRAYRSFFMKNLGGSWDADEIVTLLNPTRNRMRAVLNQCKQEQLDYFLFVFSGHGGFSRLRGQTVMELSSQADGEHDLDESELFGIALRQLSIFDCCRSYYNETIEKIAAARTMLLNAAMDGNREMAKAIYNQLVLNSCPTHIRLYACRIGESAEGVPDEGGVFSKNLLNVNPYFPSYVSMYSVEEAFENAKYAIIDDPNAQQIPSASLPRCLASQRLPWAIHEDCYLMSL